MMDDGGFARSARGGEDDEFAVRHNKCAVMVKLKLLFV